jgi:phage shock protein A
MAYSKADGQQQLLDTVAEAIDELGAALAALGAAYEELDENHGDDLEAQLFRPVQQAYARAQRTHSGFAARTSLAPRTFAQPEPGSRQLGAKGFIDDAIEAITAADDTIITLQDSLLPVEVGDREVRADLAATREILDDLPARAEELLARYTFRR